jgi:hypothetical protein
MPLLQPTSELISSGNEETSFQDGYQITKPQPAPASSDKMQRNCEKANVEL